MLMKSLCSRSIKHFLSSILHLNTSKLNPALTKKNVLTFYLSDYH